MSNDRYMQEMTARERQRARRKAENQRKMRNRRYFARLVAFLIVIISITLVFLAVRSVVRHVTGDERAMETVLDEKVDRMLKPKVKKVYQSPEITQNYIRPNEYSRPQDSLPCVNAVFVHYTANANTTAEQNRSYFDGLADSGETSASAHYIIGYDGKIIQCIPLDEIAYAVKKRNFDSISIECCYLDESGKFTEETYEALVALTAWLMGKYDLEISDVVRHYDEGGKNCPKYYVEHEEAWNRLREDIEAYIERYGVYEEDMPLEEKEEGN